MKPSALLFAIAVSLTGVVPTASAATFYVSQANPAPMAPYTNWATAANVIQDAVDVAQAGDLVLVTNGIYATGGRAVYGIMTNRVTVDKPLLLLSVNGPETTIIQGNQVSGTTNGVGAVRCVYLIDGALLAGFTLTNGATQASGDSDRARSGGGCWCESASAVVSNCVLTGNSAAYRGGGVCRGTVNNCILTGNKASGGGGGGAYDATVNNSMLSGNLSFYGGGGAEYGVLNNCTLIGNSAKFFGGGASKAALNNCIVYHNKAPTMPNYSGGATFNYCCTTPLPTDGIGNLDSEPLLASFQYLSRESPCRTAGSPVYANGVDIDGEPWSNPPSIGCDEYWSGSATGALSARILVSNAEVTTDFPLDLQALISGRTSVSSWDFGDGLVVSNQPCISHAWARPGIYLVELRAFNESHSNGVSASVTVHVAAQTVHYVDLSSPSPVPPYESWATAATNIQDAIEAATVPGALVLVTNGVYATGAYEVHGMRNRVAITKPITVRSVNGPEVTIIRGYQVPGISAVRCVYMIDGATLEGFTLTQGATMTEGHDSRQKSGGALWCESLSAVVSNCVLRGNSAAYYAGGAYYGTLNYCTLMDNSCTHYGGGASESTLNNCVLTNNRATYNGGGANSALLNNCTLTGNRGGYGSGASWSTLNDCNLTNNYGAGAYESELNNCSLIGNSGRGAEASTLNNCRLSGNLGGGASSCTLNGCEVNDNSADAGGGASYCTLNNCAVTGNSAYDKGGGVVGGTLNNCTLTGNSAKYFGGGAYSATLNNCIVYYNTAPRGANYADSTLNYCCTAPLPETGTGNLAADPQIASLTHLSSLSACRGAGSAAYISGVDIDGEPWANPPAIGCDEYRNGSVTGPLNPAIFVSYTNVASGFRVQFKAVIAGRTSASRWDFGDGAVVSNQPCASHAWKGTGDYAVELRVYNESYPEGVATSITMRLVTQPVHAVAAGNPTPSVPFLTWATAAAKIQDAINVATVPGALILVSNGTYSTGSQAVYGMNNRVAVTKPVIVRSLNGPAVTIIRGYQVPQATNGAAAVRCAYLTNDAVLTGFTITNGATQTTGDVDKQQSGGGVWCESDSAVVSNCVLTGNSAFENGGGGFWGTLVDCALMRNVTRRHGGGAHWSTLKNCTLTGNSAGVDGGGVSTGAVYYCTLTANSALRGGGALDGTLDHCVLSANLARYGGGGAFYGTLNNCVLTGNSAQSVGGGGMFGTYNNCAIIGNTANDHGGGVYIGALNNCVVAGNSASSGGGTAFGSLSNCTLVGNSVAFEGGGVYDGALNNCIVYYNRASSGANWHAGTWNYCCTTPLPTSGTSNFPDEPLFADTNGWSNLRLQSSSQCIDAGQNAYAPGSTDLDGAPRLVGTAVDVGAYEFQPGRDALFLGWLQSYGIPTDGSADGADPDGDQASNWQEWVADTDPTNRLSSFRVRVQAIVPDLTMNVQFFGSANRVYTLRQALNLEGAAWLPVPGLTDVPGIGGQQTFFNTNAPLSGFYRLEVRRP